MTLTGTLHIQLGRLLPGYNIHLAIAEGPFEDDDGVGAHFEAAALQPNKGVEKQVAALKVDLHVSVAKLARSAAMHKPRIVFGQGQGAVVATLPMEMPDALKKCSLPGTFSLPSYPRLTRPGEM